METMRTIYVRNNAYAVDFDCVVHTLTFPSAKPRDPSVIDLIVVHDTAGEGDGKQIHRSLITPREGAPSGLSIHFAIDRRGLVWQFLDPALFVAAHAGKGNNTRSIGIEMANAVFPPDIKPGLFSNLKRYALTGKERLLGRPVIVDGYRGGKRRVLGHFPEQIEAARKLVRQLLIQFPSVPPRLPTYDSSGKPHGDLVPPGWQGVAGHLNLVDKHVDPAMDVLYGMDLAA